VAKRDRRAASEPVDRFERVHLKAAQAARTTSSRISRPRDAEIGLPHRPPVRLHTLLIGTPSV
jgi:hypothetical protein